MSVNAPVVTETENKTKPSFFSGAGLLGESCRDRAQSALVCDRVRHPRDGL